MEETAAGSGISEALALELGKVCPTAKVYNLDLGSDFVTHGAMDALYRHCGLDGAAISKKVKEVLVNEN